MAKNRNHLQRQRDLEITAELYLKGWSQTQIANYLEVSQPLISRDLKAIKAGWNAQRLEKYDAYINQELDRLRLLEKEVWDAWERSKTAKEQTLSEQLRSAAVDDDITSGPAKVKVQRRTIEQVGDPKFLEQLLKIHQARARLLGLGDQTTAPKTQDATLAISTPQLAMLAEYLTSESATAE